MAADMVAIDFDGVLYDADQLTGRLSNPRSTGIPTLSGIAYVPGHGVLTIDAATNHLFRLNISTGAATDIGFIGLDMTEGDLAYNPFDGKLYASQTAGASRLITIDPATGQGSIVGIIDPFADISALAFHPSGTLWGLDTEAFPNQFFSIDPLTATINATHTLTGPIADLGSTAGMAFDPEGNHFLYAVGMNKNPAANPVQNDMYFATDPSAGVLRPVGHAFDNPDISPPLSGLAFIPEPASAALLLLGVAGLLAVRRR